MYGTNINNKGKKEKNQKIKEGPCIFPFMYIWKSHDKCYKTEKGEICATQISMPRRTLKKRGYCIKKSTKKKTLINFKYKYLSLLITFKVFIKKEEKKRIVKNKKYHNESPKSVIAIKKLFR